MRNESAEKVKTIKMNLKCQFERIEYFFRQQLRVIICFVSFGKTACIILKVFPAFTTTLALSKSTEWFLNWTWAENIRTFYVINLNDQRIIYLINLNDQRITYLHPCMYYVPRRKCHSLFSTSIQRSNEIVRFQVQLNLNTS